MTTTAPPPADTGATGPTGTRPAGADRAPAPAPVRRRARAAGARSAAGARTAAAVLGVLLLAGGTLAVLLSTGLLGEGRAARPVLDPLVVDALRAQPTLARGIAIAAGVLLAVLGLLAAVRAVRPERRPDLAVDVDPDTDVVVAAGAVAEAVSGQAGALPGVARATARLVGRPAAPALRLTVRVTEDAEVREVLRRLDTEVLATARSALGLATLPVAVRLEPAPAGDGPPRVA